MVMIEAAAIEARSRQEMKMSIVFSGSEKPPFFLLPVFNTSTRTFVLVPSVRRYCASYFFLNLYSTYVLLLMQSGRSIQFSTVL